MRIFLTVFTFLISMVIDHEKTTWEIWKDYSIIQILVVFFHIALLSSYFIETKNNRLKMVIILISFCVLIKNIPVYFDTNHLIKVEYFYSKIKEKEKMTCFKEADNLNKKNIELCLSKKTNFYSLPIQRETEWIAKKIGITNKEKNNIFVNNKETRMNNDDFLKMKTKIDWKIKHLSTNQNINFEELKILRNHWKNIKKMLTKKKNFGTIPNLTLKLY